MKITNLRTVHMDWPLGLDCTPYFSWEMLSDDQNVMQAAYRLQVTCDREETWDSGEIRSDQSAYVEYAGPPLMSRTKYAWHVTVADNHGNTAQGESGFETALLHPPDWKAQWVEAPFNRGRRKPGFGKQPPATMFRKDFQIEKKVKRARLYATCHGVYRVTLNGRRLDARELAPEHTVYGKYLCYQTYDATQAVCEGANAIGMYVGDGWYCGPHTKPSMKRHRPAHAILFQLEIEYEDATAACVVSDGSVRCATGQSSPPIYTRASSTTPTGKKGAGTAAGLTMRHGRRAMRPGTDTATCALSWVSPSCLSWSLPSKRFPYPPRGRPSSTSGR